MSIQTNKQLSPELRELLDKLKSRILDTRKIFDQFVTKAREEEYTDKEIDLLVVHHLKGILPDRSLRYYRKTYLLPEPEKRQIVEIEDKKVTEKSSTFQPNPDFERFRQERGTPHVKTAEELLEESNEQVEIKENEIPEPPQEKIEDGFVSSSWYFRDSIEIKGQEIPLIVTVYPDTKTGVVQFDEKEAKRMLRR